MFDLLPRGFALLAIQLSRRSTSQTPLNAVYDGLYQLQIAQQAGSRRGGSFLLRLPLRFEKQLGIIQNAFTDRR
jgi:hypothetical protein